MALLPGDDGRVFLVEGRTRNQDSLVSAPRRHAVKRARPEIVIGQRQIPLVRQRTISIECPTAILAKEGKLANARLAWGDLSLAKLSWDVWKARDRENLLWSGRYVKVIC